MKKTTELERFKVKQLYKTGCINQKQLAVAFKMTQENVSRIVREKK